MPFSWGLAYFAILLCATVSGEMTINAGDDVLNITQSGALYYVYMNENNHNYTDPTQILQISGASDTPTVIFVTSNRFTYSITASELRATQYFDYETQPSAYTFTLQLGDQLINVNLNIINIDDEQPSLSPPMCNFKENYIYDKNNSTCNSTVSDPDGWLSLMTFTIIDSSGGRESSIFEFQYKTMPNDRDTSALVNVVLNEELDYENIIFYSFDVVARDNATHSTIPNENVRALTYVIDQNDEPPIWTSSFTFDSFEEEKLMKYTVTAQDGDTGIMANINYKLIRQQTEICNCISIDEISGEIIVQPIDRDEHDISTYIFSIMAYETETPSMNVSLDITFFIQDIDDNLPLIGSILTDGKNTTFNESEDKRAALKFDENYAGDLDITIAIRDLDTGENAQFSVELVEIESSKVDYTDAFIVVPTAGYRSGNFFISVRNSTKLDYEDIPWQNIQFKVVTKGAQNQTKQNEMLVEITLNDLNDEWPIFLLPQYAVSINETLGMGEFIKQVLATDADYEDKILNHTLSGSNIITRLLKIDPASGNISVAVENAFDFDTINPIFVQVQAIDAVGHTTTAPLTITLLDINNKAPVITVSKTILVDENQIIGSLLNTDIVATDVDTTRKLEAAINWDVSYAMKNSRRLDMTNDTIRQQVEFLNLQATDSDAGSIEIKLEVNDKNPTQTTPDFELFDSLFLNITVTDLNTDPDFLHNKFTTALILISIGDLNDNPPIFTEDTLGANRTVREDAHEDDIIGSILAIDADVGDIVTYECVAQKEDFDWITVNTNTGELRVRADNLIDADTDKTYTIDYNCSASDGEPTHTTYALIRIYILDTNNKHPTLTLDATVSVKEKQPEGTIVKEIVTSDLDRDEPFHTVQCEFENQTCSRLFTIDSDNIIKVGSTELDRDRGAKQYECPIKYYDNPDNLQNGGQNTDRTSVIIVLEDINDNAPELITNDLSTNENYKKGQTIGEIVGKDIDAGLNAEIVFKISEVWKNNEKITNDLFEIQTGDNYVQDETHKVGNLVALKDLKDYYGNYTLTLFLTDKGTPPMNSTASVALAVERFNYQAPRFIFPEKDSKTFTLLSTQTIGSQLNLYKNNELFPNFYATDNEDDICSVKWDMQLTIEQVTPTDDIIFTVSTAGLDRCTGQLQLKDNYDKDTALKNTYQLNITATLRDGTPADGEEPYSTTATIIIGFYDNSVDPIFQQEFWEFCFLEAYNESAVSSNDSYSQKLQERAYYPNLPDDSLSIYYFLVTSNETVTDTFDVDNSDGTVTLKEALDYETDKQFQFKMLSSKSSTNASSDDSRSYLPVTVDVIDINDNTPKWTKDFFFGAIMSSYTRYTTILTADATDADEIDEVLTYNLIDNSLIVNGTGLDNIGNEPFLLTASTGEIRLNFQVDNVMSGNFKFGLQVSDKMDEYGFGPHTNKTTVTIFIITSENTVNFRFENTLVQVVGREADMLKIIGEQLGYDCYTQNIDKDSENGAYVEDRTVATLYFVNGTEIVRADDILSTIYSVNTFSSLRSALLDQCSLVLMSFTTEASSQNLEGLLRAWLIGVSVVLGALCVIMLVAFVFKTRELNRRITNLTQKQFGSEESDLNRMGINLPTSNIHAIEGSNPVFNNDVIKKDLRDFDQASVRSGDSDLIGIEDSPEFDFFNNNSKDTSEYI